MEKVNSILPTLTIPRHRSALSRRATRKDRGDAALLVGNWELWPSVRARMRARRRAFLSISIRLVIDKTSGNRVIARAPIIGCSVAAISMIVDARIWNSNRLAISRHGQPYSQIASYLHSRKQRWPPKRPSPRGFPRNGRAPTNRAINRPAERFPDRSIVIN